VSAQVYYQRLCQRIVTSISTETGEGRLYDVDLRLRPDGKSGALATQLSGFEAYYRYPQGEAWTWEHMALTRARPVYGPREFQERLTRMIRDILCQKRDPDQVIRDVKTMRERIRKEYPGTSAFDIKYRPGGLLDIEFIAQTLQLLYASQMPEILHTNTARALEALGAHRILRDRDTKILRQALGLWLCLQATLRLTQRGEFDPHTAPEGQRRALAHAAGVKSFDALEAHFQATSHQVSDIYHALFQDSFTGLSDPG
jgi:glutamate-ammonia-ligase adenylyltransferase